MRLVQPIVLSALIACVGGAARAQTLAGNPPPPKRLEIKAGYEVHRDHLRYTFENPSNIDTDFPVPHSFTQAYVANNHWLVLAARYLVGGDAMESEFAITPERQTPGSDLDTFYDPNHDVVVSGTAGDVLLRSLRFAHWSEGRVWGLPWRVGYAYRRDRSQFLPADRTVTHSNPPSEARSPTYGRETTISQAHEIRIEVSRPTSRAMAWRVVPRVELSPLILAQLTTILPDKYPGQHIVFNAKAVAVRGGIELVRQKGVPVGVSLDYGQTWGYRSARQYRCDTLVAGVRLGLF